MTNQNDPNRIRERDGMGMGTIVAIAVAAVLGLGTLLWAVAGNRTVATTDTPRIERTTPAPSTTGQGGAAVNPGPAQTTPNPTPPASPPAAR